MQYKHFTLWYGSRAIDCVPKIIDMYILMCVSKVKKRITELVTLFSLALYLVRLMGVKGPPDSIYRITKAWL